MSKVFLSSLGKKQTWPHLDSVHPLSLTYDDILLVPQENTQVISRSHVNTSVQLGPYTLTVPVVSAPMDTISGELMVRTLASLGALGSLPRGNLQQNVQICKRLSEDHVPCLYAIGLKDGIDAAKTLKDHGAEFLLIDVAHGGQKEVMEFVKSMKEKVPIDFVVGNIATYAQAKWYKENGIDIARIGVGPGGLCSTRLVTGVGMPQLSAIFDTVSAGVQVIADGGIRHPGDVAKAIAAGAQTVMIGSLFAGCEETPGEVLDGRKYVRGQASADYMKDNNVSIDINRAPEGVSISVNVKGSVRGIIEEIAGGLRSAMSYSNAHTIGQFQDRAAFVVVSPSAQRENTPHIVQS